MLNTRTLCLACGVAALVGLPTTATAFGPDFLEDNFGDGMWTELFKPVLFKEHRVTIEAERSTARRSYASSTPSSRSWPATAWWSTPDW